MPRQNLAHQPRTTQQVADIRRGGYILRDSKGAPQLILIATGSEVELAMQAASQLGDGVRVVSMPSTDVFDRQDAAYRDAVFGGNRRQIANDDVETARQRASNRRARRARK